MGSQKRDWWEGGLRAKVEGDKDMEGAHHRERKRNRRKQLGLHANIAMSCPLSSLLRSLYSDWSRRPHDAGGFPGLLWSCARVSMHAGIGEYPFCAPYTHSRAPCPQDPIEQMG